MSTSDGKEERQNIAELQENFNKQQAKISALKELVRKSEEAHGKSTSSTQEKVKNIAQRLTHLKSKARSRKNLDRSFSEFRDDPILEETSHVSGSPLHSAIPPVKARSETPGSEKIQLLRQQMEQNKIKMAERENSKREIEELVTQLKARIDSTQQSLERSSELGRSMGDLTCLTSTNPVSSKFKSATDLSFTPINLDKEKIKFLENRVKNLEKHLEKEKNTPKVESEIVKILESKILDLEENLKEKECIIQARTQAVSLMTESLSAKGKTTVDMLEDTKQEMFKMQSSFVDTEDTLRGEIQQLKSTLEDKEMKITNLEEVNDILETARFDLTVKNAELESKTKNAQDYSTKISELNKLNETLQHRISDLEGQIADAIEPENVDLTKQIGEEYAKTVKNLQEKIRSLETENDELKKFAQEAQDAQATSSFDSDISVKIGSLESTIQAQREEIANHISTIQQLEEQLAEKTIEYNVLNANFSVLQEKLKASAPRSLFSSSSYEEAEIEINKLKTQLDEANKAMIKMKLKAKQLQKQVDGFNKTSDVHAELIKVTGENEQLQQRILELEEEKGQLQLNLVTGESTGANDAELEKKIQILETTCQNQTSAIQLLEEQKLDMTENLQSTKQELESLKDQMNDQEETALVVSQIETIQLEEKVHTYATEVNQFKTELDRFKKENENLNETVEKLQKDKDDLGKKVDHYIAENIELLDKIEKLSKSSSSAESIEIVERLTHQEKLEIEEFNKRLEEEHEQDHVDDHLQSSSNPHITNESSTAMGQELSESLTKLREESSELMHRIELFTTERREVLEKMEHLNNENEEHISRINELVQEKDVINANLTEMKEDKHSLEEKYNSLEKERNELLEQISESNKQRVLLTEEMNVTKKERNSVNYILQGSSIESDLLKDYEKSLSRLSAEVDNFSKASNKINSSKKLAKEAKNVCQQMTVLLQKINTHQPINENEVSKEVRQKCADFEKIIETLQKDYKDAVSESNRKDEEITTLTLQLNSLRQISEDMGKTVNEKEATYDDQISHLKQIRKDVEAKLQAANNEIDILKILVSEQKQQLIESYTEQDSEMQSKSEKIEQYEQEIESLKRELETVQSNKSQTYEKYVEELKAEIRKLELLLNENKSLAAQQTQELINKQETVDSLNAQIVELYKSIEEGINKVAEKEEEVAYLQELLDSNRFEMDKLIKENNENKNVIEKLLLELHSQTEKIAQVESFKSIQEQNRQFEVRIKELERLNSDYELRCKEQHDKLRKFAANLKKKVAQCSELENKIKEFNETAKQNADTNVTDTKALEYQDRIMEIENLNEKLVESNSRIEGLLQDKDLLRTELDKRLAELEHYKHLSEVYLTKIDETSLQLGELQILVEISRSEFDEKLKKEQALQQQIDQMQNEHEDKIKTLVNDLNAKNVKFEKSKAIIKEKIREIQRLSKEKEELAQKLNSKEVKVDEEGSEIGHIKEENIKLKDDYDKLLETYQMEKITFQETISRLETVHDGIQAKLQEDLAYIESLETENNKFKEKIFKLEECVACFEDRRASLEQYANLLDAQLQQKADEYEKNEDVLVYRLNTLSKHDDIIGRRLLETQEEKEELTDKLERSKHEYSDLMKKFTKLEKKFESFHTEKYEKMEFENQTLRDQVAALQTEIDNLQTSCEVKLASKTAEIDELENDLSIQLQNVNTEKRALQENLEKSCDEVQSLKDENVRLKENSNSLEQIKNDLEREITWIRLQNENLSQDQFELQELRMQVIQDKTEIENQKHQLETISQTNEIELNVLRTQIAELDSMRMQVSKNQTDDQVFIETENKRLKELLSEKETIIDNYQRQNLQLQMSALSVATADPFAAITEGTTSMPTPTTNAEYVEISSLQEKCKAYAIEVADLKSRIVEKDEQHNKFTGEIANLQQIIQQTTLERQQEINNLKAEIDRLRVPRNDITTPFIFEQPTSSVFDELATIREVRSLELGIPDQKKIEDLERNVSDLEKYAAELENKLKHLTHVHENTLKLLQQKTLTLQELEKNSTIRIQDLEVKEKQLNTQQNIEKIWGENKDSNASYISMFFDNAPEESEQTTSAEFLNQDESNIPVEEEIIVPKKAYICHPKEELALLRQQQEAGDDWGWGSEEAALDEKHYHSTIGYKQYSLLSPEKNMEVKLQEYQDRINELELERNRLEEQKVELQVKSGKMMKKLKEYKNTIAQLSNSQASFRKSSSIESNDLDLAIQEELKSQISKLEEKLTEMRKQNDKDTIEKVNLLKRVDVLTAANERMTEMKERQDIQVEAYQTQVRQLSQQLKTLEDWSENANQAHEEKLKTHTQVDSGCGGGLINQEDWEKKYFDASHELEDLKVDRDELQALLDEEKENHKLSENKIQALQVKVNMLEEAMQEHSRKNERRTSLDAEHQTLRNEFNEMKLRNQELQLLLSDYQSTIEQLSSESNSIKANLDILRDEHRLKLDENSKLTSELVDSWIERNKHIEGMQLAANDSGNVVSQNHIQCEQKITELKEKLSVMENEILFKERQISELLEEKKEWREMTEKFNRENLDQLEIVTQLQTKLESIEAEKCEFQEKIKILQRNIEELQSEKVHMENELQVLNNHVIASLENEDKIKQTVLELDMKNIEIVELKKSLEIFKAQQISEPNTKDNLNQEQLEELNAQWEAIVEQRCGEVAESWRTHLAEKENEMRRIEDSLKANIEELKMQKTAAINLRSNDSEGGEDNIGIFQKMQAALENQELEIVTLKEQLAMRSAEYARLAAQHDPYALTTTSSHIDHSSLVQKSELDLALYMLHQRDMRCEELTLELVNLLEERDTLQLKLSNSLRQVEEIKRKTGYFESGSESDHGGVSNPDSPEKARPRTSNTVSEEELLKENEDLNSKLSQLHAVTHPKDNRLLEERNQSQRGMDKIQEDVANMPSEAVSELVGKDLSNTDQSPSTVLLNWLWGKTTNPQQN